MESIFFGLETSYKESLLEQLFILQYHLGMSYSDARSLPIPYRQWFIKRLSTEFEKKSQSAGGTTSSGENATMEVPMGRIGPRSFK